MKTKILLLAVLTVRCAIAGTPEVIVPTASTNPLSFADGRVVFDVEERLRYEFRNNAFDFNHNALPATDGSFLLQRARVGMKFEPVDWFRFYAQFQSSIEVGNRGDEPGVSGSEGDDYADLYQGYVEFADYDRFPLGLRAGRQLFNYGDQRLIGSFDWNNLGRSFDAARVRYQADKFWAEAFAASVVTVERADFNFSDVFNWDDTDRQQVFSGIYASTDVVTAHRIDGYLLWLSQAKGNVSNFGPLLGLPPAGSQGGDPALGMNFGTLGLRLNNVQAKMHGWEYDAELAGQAGRLAGLDLLAFALHAGGGYNFHAPWEPRIYLQYNYASGDWDSTDGQSTTFQNLFPTNHKFYGYMDLFSWQNMHNPSVTFNLKPHRTLTLAADGHLFWLATTSDAWYRANGLTQARPITPSADPFVGGEIDLTATWKPTSFLSLLVGYSWFLPGAYVDDTGPADPANFLYVQMELKF
ncbi:MAG: alginate export family protein [Chthoniobacterales bacterium]|nr:alginate export family protein [Chthoniobacterales bacterium]